MMTSEMILPALILIPFIGGFLCWIAERLGMGLPRWIAVISMALVTLLGLQLWQTGDFSLPAIGSRSPHWQLEFVMPWLPSLGVKIHLALDGLSLLMVILTGILGVLATACSWNEIQRHVGFFHLNLLWSLGGVIGVFLAIDMFLFFFFWEMMLVPVYFLIALWGHQGADNKSRIYAATKFFIFTQASGLIMLIGILALVLINYHQTHVLSFDYLDLLKTQIPAQWEMPLMLCFFVAFAVKLPIVPFHSWLPDAHAQAPTAGSVDLAGILLKTAAYGMLRFALPLFPNASQEFAPVAMALGLFGIFYGALLAFVQTDIKRLIAFTSVSHMGFVLIGIYAGNLMTMQGLVMQMLAHGFSAAGLFILCGEIYERIHTRDLREMGGMWGRFKYLPAIMMFFAAALLGMPGTGNFVGEFLILLGSYKEYPVVSIVATSSLVLAGVYSLIMIHRALFGQPKDDRQLEDLSPREIAIMVSLMGILLFLGLYPQPVLDVSVGAMAQVEQAYHAVPAGIPAVISAPVMP